MNVLNDVRFYQRLVGLVQGACCIVDPEGVIFAINREAVRLLGVPFKKGDRFSDIVVVKNAQSPPPFTVFLSSSSLIPSSLTIRSENGEVRSLSCRGGVLRPASNDSGALLMVHIEEKAESVEKFTALNRKIVELADQIQLRKIAEDKLTLLNKDLEAKVQQRTAELAETHSSLLEASRKAGMAEVATGVLHNVGNILNSVNISSNMIEEQLSLSRLAKISEACKRIERTTKQSYNNPVDDAVLNKLLDYVGQACAAQITMENKVISESAGVRENIDTIKRVVNFQQEHAVHVGKTDQVSPSSILDQTLILYEASLSRHAIEVVKDYTCSRLITVDTSKLIQVLTNLITNARESILMSSRRSGHCIKILIKDDLSDNVSFILEDSGIGITQEQFTNLFTYGYTTKSDGHGFGLHTCAIHARELGGDLKAYSDGIESGARFELSVASVPGGRGERRV